MKYLQIVLLMVCMAFSQSVMAQSNGGSNGGNKNNDSGSGLNGDGPTYVELLGETETSLPKSALLLPFEAYIQDGTLIVGALTDMDNVTVEVVNAAGMSCFVRTKDFLFMEQLVIPVSGMGKGSFTLYITSAGGTSLSGTFVLL